MQEMRARHDISSDAFVVGTFGFLLPHKGTLELIAAVAALRDDGVDAQLLAVCSIHPDPSSSEYRERCAAEVRRLGMERFVTLTTDYLPDQVGRELLAGCDVIALPYGYTRESSSAALRFILPLRRPIVVSDVPIFDDARDVLAHVASPVDVDELRKVLHDLSQDPEQREELAAATERFCVDNSWVSVGRRLRDVYDEVVRSGRS
jgi:glycosyltransferase involved in cell wall biosynthesis